MTGNAVNRAAGFLAQTAHESAQFTAVKENLNYAAEGLMKTFKKYFPDAVTANAYGRRPEAIANRVYANRLGNGDEASGDGWKFRGRGVIQVTGKTNYLACGKFLGIDLSSSPEYLETLPGAVQSGVWYWTANNLNRYADQDDIKGLTKAINGGYIGLEERTKFYQEVKKIWGHV